MGESKKGIDIKNEKRPEYSCTHHCSVGENTPWCLCMLVAKPDNTNAFPMHNARSLKRRNTGCPGSGSSPTTPSQALCGTSSGATATRMFAVSSSSS